ESNRPAARGPRVGRNPSLGGGVSVVICDGVDAPAGLCSAGETIQPRHPVFVFGVQIGGQGKKILERAEASVADPHAAALNCNQAQLDPGNDPSQSQASKRCVEELWVFLERALQLAPVGADESEAGDVPADGATNVMILAVDVIGQSA